MAGFNWEGGNPKNVTATGVVSALPGTLLGFYVNSTAAGTLILRDGATAGSGTVLNGVLTPLIGFHRYPANLGAGLNITVGGAIDVTFFTVPGAG
jgi:hypothetical protein